MVNLDDIVDIRANQRNKVKSPLNEVGKKNSGHNTSHKRK